MTIYFLTVALLNLALGYGLAVAMRHMLGSEIPASWLKPSADDPLAFAPVEFIYRPSDAPAATLSIEYPSFARPASSADTAETVESRAQVQATLDEFEAELELYRAALAEMDNEIRNCSANPELPAITACRDDFRGINQQHLQNQTGFLNRLEGMVGPTTDPAGKRLVKAMATQTQEVRALDNQLGEIDVESNALLGCQQLLEGADRLAEANAGLRRTLDQARQIFAHPAPPPDANKAVAPESASQASAEQAKQRGLTTRAELERALEAWWQNDPERKRPLTLGLIEIDRVAQIHDSFGPRTLDNVQQTLATLTISATRGDDLAAHSTGHGLLLMFPDTGARSATSAVERVRQSIEATQFLSGPEAVSVSVTCAVAEAVSTDTTDSLLSRLQATLVEAQGYGGNRTFLHEGMFPAPVTPPAFSLEPRVVSF